MILNEILDIAKREAKPPLQSVPRRKLADISNLPQNVNKPSIQGKSQSIETTNKVYIDQLQKVIMFVGIVIFIIGLLLMLFHLSLIVFFIQENMALVEMLAQRKYPLQ